MPGFNPARWFIEGEVDWDAYREWLNKWGPALAGALFAAGWWCWIDALIYQKAVLQAAYPWKYNWPGIGEDGRGRVGEAAVVRQAAVWRLAAPQLEAAACSSELPPSTCLSHPQWPRWRW